jgi:hypothetical protein
MDTTQKFDLWCLVELFGHTKIYGRCTEQNIAGSNMLRVDVPETSKSPAFTRFFGSSAIYSICPLDEKTCRHMAERNELRPIESWNISELAKKHNLLIAAAPEKSDAHDNEDPEDDYPPGPHEHDTGFIPNW